MYRKLTAAGLTLFSVVALCPPASAAARLNFSCTATRYTERPCGPSFVVWPGRKVTVHRSNNFFAGTVDFTAYNVNNPNAKHKLAELDNLSTSDSKQLWVNNTHYNIKVAVYVESNRRRVSSPADGYYEVLG